MFPEPIEWVARERRSAFQEAAEKRRLLRSLKENHANKPTTTWSMRCWLGVHLVDWGMKLQGYRLEATTLNPATEPCNC